VLPLIVPGKIRPVINSTFPLAEACAAHARMEASSHIGGSRSRLQSIEILAVSRSFR
jgi:hypothetical protein